MAFQIILFISALGLTIYLLSKKMNIGIIMVINCIFIILSVKMKVSNIVSNAIMLDVNNPNFDTWIGNINLILILTEILIVENIMRKTKMIERMVISLRGLIGNGKLSMMILPAIIGLMPSPGGARFSCPMVGELVTDEMDNADKAFVNYWYRHIWRDGFILYPAVIIGAELMGVAVTQLFFHIVPFSILHILVGYFFIRKKIKVKPEENNEDKKYLAKTFVKNFLPVVIIISLYMILLTLFGETLNIKGISTIILLNISALPVIIYLLIQKKYNWEKIKITLKEAFQIKLIVIILGVMIFREFLSNSGLIDSWIDFMTVYKIPKEILYIVLPFIAGFTSGLAINYASLALPILIPLGIGDNIWLATAAMMAGFTGLMLTPLHLCNVMSCDYFKTSFNKVLPKVIVTESFMMSAIILTIFIFR